MTSAGISLDRMQYLIDSVCDTKTSFREYFDFRSYNQTDLMGHFLPNRARSYRALKDARDLRDLVDCACRRLRGLSFDQFLEEGEKSFTDFDF